jgi:hypothetical protein
MKLPNKAAGEIPAAAEVVEGRLRAKGNAGLLSIHRTLRRTERDLQLCMRRALLRWRLIVGT